MEVPDVKKYKAMENVLNKINQKYISLPEKDVKRNNVILRQVIDPIVERIKEKSTLFKNLYERQFYGGSFYDGIRVSKPEEYDLDLVLNLPAIITPNVAASDLHGFVCVSIDEYMNVVKHKETARYEKLEDLLTDDTKYLSTTKVLVWMEKIISLAMNTFEKEADGICFNVKLSNEEEVKIYAALSKAHPAFTLKLKNKDGSIILDVDLVPCFQFSQEKWPMGNYRANKTKKSRFLVVPKKPHSVGKDPVEKYWRLSFQEQERELMDDHRTLKPALKLMKKLRDKHNHKISSYFIKTVFLWEVDDPSNNNLWSQPLSVAFMAMLKKYANYIKDGKIPYYWNKEFNLIGNLKEVTIIGIGNTLQNIVATVERNLDEPFTIAKYLIEPEEITCIRKEVDLPKKHKKIQSSSLDCVDGPALLCPNNNNSGQTSTTKATVVSNDIDILTVLNRLERKIDAISAKVDQTVTTCSQLESRLASLERHVQQNNSQMSRTTEARDDFMQLENNISLLGDRLLETMVLRH